MYLYVFLIFLGSLPLLLFPLLAFLFITHPKYRYINLGNQVSPFIPSMCQSTAFLIFSLSNLTLVLVSPFVGHWPLLVVMFQLVSLPVAQSGLPADMVCLESVFGLCCLGVLWVLDSCLLFCNVCIYVFALYG